MKPADRNALELALQIFDKAKGAAAPPTVISLASTEAEPILKEAIALGAERAILVSDGAFPGGDETVVAALLARVVSQLNPDLVLCGGGQVGLRLAEALQIRSIDQVVGVQKDEALLSVTRKTLSDVETVSASSPILLSVVPGCNVPRIANALKIMKAAKKEIVHWTATQIGVGSEAGADELKADLLVPGLETVRLFSPDLP